MQRRAGRVHRQVPEGPDERRPPALGFGPLDGQHVVGEDRPEGLRRQGGGFEALGGQLDSQVCCLDKGGGALVKAAVYVQKGTCLWVKGRGISIEGITLRAHFCTILASGCLPPCFATVGGAFVLPSCSRRLGLDCLFILSAQR